MAKGRGALPIAVGLLLVLSVAALASQGPRTHARDIRYGRGHPPAGGTTPAVPTTKPPPPPVVAFVRKPADPKLHADVLIVEGDGSGERGTSIVPYRRTQVSTAANVLVRSNATDTTELSTGRCNANSGCPSATRSEADIIVASADGSNERKLTQGGYDTKPVLSADGRLIAFVRHAALPVIGVTDEIGVIDTTGAVVSEMPPPPSFRYIEATWSPDGQRVAAVRTRNYDPLVAAIDLLSLDGAPTRTLAEGPWSEINWSHDGTRLVGVRASTVTVNGGPNAIGSDLWILPLDGSVPTKLTHMASTTTLPPRPFCTYRTEFPSFVNQPMWAPDDSRVAFLADADHQPSRPGVQDVMTIRVDGTDQRALHRTRSLVCKLGPPQPQVLIVETTELLGWVTAA